MSELPYWKSIRIAAIRFLCAVAVLLALVHDRALAQAADPKFGVIIDGTTSYYPAAYPEVVNAHLGWVRLHAFWRFIELVNGGCSLPSPTAQQCNWGFLDQNVNDAYNRGRQIYIGMGFFPPQWANGTEGRTCNIHVDSCAGNPPTDLTYYPNFVKAVVNRYKDRVQHYAIWNEPDLSANWNSTTSRFVSEILIPGADAVRAASSTAKVIGGEVADNHTMLGNMLWGGACAKLDYVAVHLFRYDVTKNVNHLQNDYIPAINQQCGSTKPVWVTAFGFPLDKLPASSDPLALQAQMLRDQFAALDAIPRVGRIIFYNMVDTSNPGQQTGLLTSSFARKPSFYAIEQYLPSTQTVWVDDSLPAGALAAGDAEGWKWVNASPAPLSGTLNHQSELVAGMHQHYFYGASATLNVSVGDYLVAYVYLDPVNPPSEVMLQWNDGSWEHRAYWGANNITAWGVNGTASRRYMGPLPATGKWVRLEVPASQVGLEGRPLNGMAFTLFGGKATWDRAGKRAN
ncbi:MAG TPA: glycosyl hydrolase [Thermoanaerobaculia bacterium]|jgi:hypothetical protein